MARSTVLLVLCISLFVSSTVGKPALLLDPEARTPLAELNSRVTSRLEHLNEPRFPIPTAQDLEAIRKVAQILVMLGQQVIPAILGDTQQATETTVTVIDIPNDPVTGNK